MEKTMKFSKQTKSAIYREARRKVGGFGMWLEVQERYIPGEPSSYYTNRLRKDDDDSDLSDFIHWNDFCDHDFEMINGHTLIDVPVHDKEELLDNLLCLINDRGELIRSFTVFEACGPDNHKTTNEFLKQYEQTKNI
jgi:hypothetical protein